MVIGTSASVATSVGLHGNLTAVNCSTFGSGQTVCTSNGISGAGLAVLVIFYLVIAVVFLVAEVKIITKAGYSGWWVLSTFVPIFNMIMFLVFAFRKWPVQSRVDRMRTPIGYWGPAGTTPRDPGSTQPWGGAPAGGPTASPETEGNLPPFGQGPGPGPSSATVLEPGPSSSPTAPSGAPQPQPSAQAPAGWYPTPDGRRRYWDGAAWTDHFA